MNSPRGVVQTRQHPILNINRDMENQARRRNERFRNNVNPRDRLFYALFIKIGHVYLRLVPENFRVILEIIVLLKGLVLFSILSYLHFSFGRTPLNCLNTTKGSWPRDGILRVQIQPEYSMKRQLPRFYSSEENRILFHPCHNNNMNTEKEECASIKKHMKAFYNYKKGVYSYKAQCYRMNLSDFMRQQQSKHWKEFESFEYVASDKTGKLFTGFQHGDIINESNLISFYDLYLALSEPERHHIFEYSLEFGFLRLSQETRERLKIPVKVVSLDPYKEKCFGDKFSQFVLKYFLGYDDIIMNSIKKVADIENNTGYMLNVVTGDHYKFVSWGIGKSSYFISFLLMFLFTISISTLLRYCHQQVFFFIIHILRMMDMNVMLAFPIAPLFTVILSLVGMETIMSEYFNDTTTSFYIILMVWAVDQFDSICCHTTISQKYWPRFFYLYHFIFYAYHYRFNGQYSFIALAATWFLIQHSMLYFFHNYELPAIEQQLRGHRDDEAYLDEAVQMIVEGIEMVAGQNNNENGAQPADQQQQQQPQQQDGRSQQQQQQQQDQQQQNGGNQGNVRRGRMRGIATADNGNRVFLFAGEGPFLQMIREFVRQVHRRLNAPTPRDANDIPRDAPENQATVHGNSENPVESTANLPIDVTDGNISVAIDSESVELAENNVEDISQQHDQQQYLHQHEVHQQLQQHENQQQQESSANSSGISPIRDFSANYDPRTSNDDSTSQTPDSSLYHQVTETNTASNYSDSACNRVETSTLDSCATKQVTSSHEVGNTNHMTDHQACAMYVDSRLHSDVETIYTRHDSTATESPVETNSEVSVETNAEVPIETNTGIPIETNTGIIIGTNTSSNTLNS